MKMSDAFPSQYIKAADLQGREINVTIDHVTLEDLGDDRKPVVYFTRGTKGLVLNRTNGATIAAAYGDETEEWTAKPITLYATSVLFQGRSVEAIRVRVPKAPKPTPAPGHDNPRDRGPDIGDDIPF